MYRRPGEDGPAGPQSTAHRCARGGGLEPPTTGPEPVVLPIPPPPKGEGARLPSGVARSHAVGAVQDARLAAEAYDPADRHGDGLPAHVPQLGDPLDGARPGRRRRGIEADVMGDGGE